MDGNDNVKEGIRLLTEGMSKLSHGPFEYYLTCLVQARDLLLTRFAPFKVGDRVAICRKLDIKPDSAWFACLHYLKPGSIGTVHSSEVDRDGRLRFDVVFDDESWVDRDNGSVHPIEEKDRHTYCMFEGDIVKIFSGA